MKIFFLILHLDRGRMVILKVYWQRIWCSCSWKWNMTNNYNCILDRFRQAYLLLFITGKSKRGPHFVLKLYKLYSYLDCRCKFDILMNTFSRFMLRKMKNTRQDKYPRRLPAYLLRLWRIKISNPCRLNIDYCWVPNNICM